MLRFSLYSEKKKPNIKMKMSHELKVTKAK